MTVIPRLLLLARTLRHLRPEQIAGQIIHRLKSRHPAPRRLVAGRPSSWPGLRRRDIVLLPPPANRNTPADLLRGRLTFINESRDLGGLPPDWNPPGTSKLWLYNLHYFEWLWLLEPADAVRVIDDWIATYPLERGKDGWEPYPVSLRLMNWAGWLQCHEAALDPAFRERLWGSIWLQAEWLLRRLEYHLLGNHLLENAFALAFVGNIFDGPTAERWAEVGHRLLDRELPEQVLPDGVHFELSPMYHLRVLAGLDWVVAVAPAHRREQWAAIADRMRTALPRMTHPDGGIALLNDSAFGIYHTPAALIDGPPVPGPFSLPDAGYYGARTQSGDYVIVDAGPPGPGYIPGHAHGDLLSLELSVGGRRLLTDSGVHDYLNSPTRAYCRSTRAHNTVEIEGRDQSEFWGAFRVARRAHPREVQWEAADESFHFAASHNGYRRLEGRPVHRREVRWSGQGSLILRDMVNSAHPLDIIGRLHFHPDVSVEPGEGTANFLAIFGGQKSRIMIQGADRVWLEESLYCPEFGVKHSRPCLCWQKRASKAVVETTLLWHRNEEQKG